MTIYYTQQDFSTADIEWPVFSPQCAHDCTEDTWHAPGFIPVLSGPPAEEISYIYTQLLFGRNISAKFGVLEAALIGSGIVFTSTPDLHGGVIRGEHPSGPHVHHAFETSRFYGPNRCFGSGKLQKQSAVSSPCHIALSCRLLQLLEYTSWSVQER